MSDSLQSMDCSPAGSSVCGILQARILEWATMLSTRRFSQPMNRTLISCIAGGFFTAEPPGSPCESVSCVILVSCVQKITDWKSFYRWKALQELIGTRYFQANLCIPNSGIFLKIMVMSFGFGQITQLVKWPGWDSDLVTTMPHGLCKVWHSIQSWGSTSNTLGLMSWRKPCPPQTQTPSTLSHQTQHPKPDLTCSPELGLCTYPSQAHTVSCEILELMTWFNPLFDKWENGHPEK